MPEQGRHVDGEGKERYATIALWAYGLTLELR